MKLKLMTEQNKNPFKGKTASSDQEKIERSKSRLLVNLSKVNKQLPASFYNLIVVDATEPDASSKALSMILPIYKIGEEKRFMLVIDRVQNSLQGPAIFEQIEELLSYIPDISLNYLGDVPSRKYLSRLLIAN
ncbi:MAG: hypothetical protein RLP12_06190 [Ekhidna sp.]